MKKKASHLLQKILSQDKVDFYKKEFVKAQDRAVDGDQPKIRFRVFYTGQHDQKNDVYDVKCNHNEIRELKRRKDLENWAIDTPELRKDLEAYLNRLSAGQEDTRLIDKILQIAPIKTRPVPGTDTEIFEVTLKA